MRRSQFGLRQLARNFSPPVRPDAVPLGEAEDDGKTVVRCLECGTWIVQLIRPFANVADLLLHRFVAPGTFTALADLQLLKASITSHERHLNEPMRSSLIASTADQTANEANIAAIDQFLKTEKYGHIVAWGKWLGFTAKTVHKYLLQAEADNAPEDAIQKIDGKWLQVADIVNDENRTRVEDLARGPRAS